MAKKYEVRISKLLLVYTVNGFLNYKRKGNAIEYNIFISDSVAMAMSIMTTDTIDREMIKRIINEARKLSK